MSRPTSPEKFTTSVVGTGPFCIEFPDGEIITTRSEARQSLIAASEALLVTAKRVLAFYDQAETPHLLGEAQVLDALNAAITDAAGHVRLRASVRLPFTDAEIEVAAVAHYDHHYGAGAFRSLAPRTQKRLIYRMGIAAATFPRP